MTIQSLVTRKYPREAQKAAEMASNGFLIVGHMIKPR